MVVAATPSADGRAGDETGALHYYTPSPIVPVTSTGFDSSGGGQFAGGPIPVQEPVQLVFGGYNRHRDLAGRLAYHANAMCLDLHYNYR